MVEKYRTAAGLYTNPLNMSEGIGNTYHLKNRVGLRRRAYGGECNFDLTRPNQKICINLEEEPIRLT
jgi:hypothetical protein